MGDCGCFLFLKEGSSFYIFQVGPRGLLFGAMTCDAMLFDATIYRINGSDSTLRCYKAFALFYHSTLIWSSSLCHEPKEPKSEDLVGDKSAPC